jgi:poly(3-hydroxybutyrate) depolymerase
MRSVSKIALFVSFPILVAALAASASPPAPLGAPTPEQRVAGLRAAVRKGEIRGVSPGSLATIEAYAFLAASRERRHEGLAPRMARRIDELLRAAEAGHDLLAEQRDILWRGYRSRYSVNPQLYSIYVPKDYDPKIPKPLLVTLHGGSSNHNLWLALNLGHEVSVADYWANHYTEFQARRHPNSIVVSPDGLGQIRWRWMGEQDVLDVIDDVSRNYSIDPDRVVLTGLSNGAIGAYTIGLKHAWRFAAVLPVAGVTDWTLHHEATGRWRPHERTILQNESAITYAENAAGTHLRFYHGDKDPGFNVQQARGMAALLERLGIPFKYHEFADQGHDLSHVLWRKLLVERFVESYRRQSGPADVRLVSASGRANRQHWVVLDERADHQRPGRLRARVTNGSTIEVETGNAGRFTLLLNEAPVLSPVTVVVDGREAFSGPLPPGGRLTLSSAFPPEDEDGAGGARTCWRPWDGMEPRPGACKTTALEGPLGDVQYEPQIHVYGTQEAKDTPILRRAAVLGARTWVAARDYTEVRHPVIPDTELTPEMMQSRAVVLYGNARSNAVLAEIGEELPIKVGTDYLELRGRRLTGGRIGARFVCPNPLQPTRYLVVQAGTDAAAVEEGGKLPIYLGDYIVYDRATVAKKAFMILGGRREIESGFFTETWELPEQPPPR